MIAVRANRPLLTIYFHAFGAMWRLLDTSIHWLAAPNAVPTRIYSTVKIEYRLSTMDPSR